MSQTAKPQPGPQADGAATAGFLNTDWSPRDASGRHRHPKRRPADGGRRGDDRLTLRPGSRRHRGLHHASAGVHGLPLPRPRHRRSRVCRVVAIAALSRQRPPARARVRALRCRGGRPLLARCGLSPDRPARKLRRQRALQPYTSSSQPSRPGRGSRRRLADGRRTSPGSTCPRSMASFLSRRIPDRVRCSCNASIRPWSTSPARSSVDPALDPFDPRNGFADPPRSSTYRPDFVSRYRAAQLERVRRLDALARQWISDRLAARRRGKEAGERAGSADTLADRRKGAHTPIMTIWRTDARPALLRPLARPVGSGLRVALGRGSLRVELRRPSASHASARPRAGSRRGRGCRRTPRWRRPRRRSSSPRCWSSTPATRPAFRR